MIFLENLRLFPSCHLVLAYERNRLYSKGRKRSQLGDSLYKVLLWIKGLARYLEANTMGPRFLLLISDDRGPSCSGYYSSWCHSLASSSGNGNNFDLILFVMNRSHS